MNIEWGHKMELQQVREEIKQLQEKARKMSHELFVEGSKQIFADFPELVSVSWRQYTPYFNDGDTCTFQAVNDYPAFVVMVDGEEIEEEEFSTAEYYKKYLNEKLLPFYPKMVAVTQWLSEFDDDYLFATFGDHAQVTLTRNGVNIDEYDHD